MSKKQHRSARGEKINFDELNRKNSEVVAVGNGRMNAKGDRLGSGGKIIRKVEDVPVGKLPTGGEAYSTNPKKAIKLASLKDDINVMIDDKKSKPKTLRDLNPEDAKTPEELVKSLSDKKENETNKRKIIDKDD